MPRLVALLATPDDDFVDGVRQAWDRGDAVLPVDPRLPAQGREQLEQVMGVGDDVEAGDALVVTTSGTTGEPKGAVLTHDAVAASAEATSARLGVDPTRDRWLACIPLAHVGGLGVVTRALVTGTPLIVRPAFETGTGATLVSVVPTILERHDVSGFRVVLAGGSADWRVRAPNVVHTYGMTETGGGIAYDGMPLDGVEVRADQDGQLWVRAPMLLRCYRHGDDPRDGDGWYPTGDAGTVDADGRVSVRGRVGDVIVTGGEKVWPDAVERALTGLAGVAEVAVAGRPDPEWGQQVVAWIVPTPGGPPTLDQVRNRVKEQLPAYCAPRALELVAALPRTPLGKVRRAKLAGTERGSASDRRE